MVSRIHVVCGFILESKGTEHETLTWDPSLALHNTRHIYCMYVESFSIANNKTSCLLTTRTDLEAASASLVHCWTHRQHNEGDVMNMKLITITAFTFTFQVWYFLILLFKVEFSLTVSFQGMAALPGRENRYAFCNIRQSEHLCLSHAFCRPLPEPHVWVYLCLWIILME